MIMTLLNNLNFFYSRNYNKREKSGLDLSIHVSLLREEVLTTEGEHFRYWALTPGVIFIQILGVGQEA